MTIIDELITEYKGEDRQTAVAERIARANEKLAGVIRSVITAMAAMNAAQWLGDLKSKAEEAAVTYSSLEARLKALTRSAEDAKRKLSFAELVAGPSPFTTKQLADATVTLEAFRINSERALPTLGKLGAAMGAGTEQIQMFVRAMGDLAQGKFIEADVLAAMGMTRADFMAEGIEFDGQGQLKSSADKALNALEAIVNKRFGNILEEMANTPEAKRASLEDAGEKIFRAIGFGFLKAEGPVVEALTTVLNAITKSGVLEEAINQITGAFSGLLGIDKADTFARIAANIIAAVVNVATGFAEMIGWTKEAFPLILENIGTFIHNVQGRWETFITLIRETGQGVIAFVQSIVKLLAETIGSLTSELSKGLRDALDSLNKLQANVKGDKTQEFVAKEYKDIPAFKGFKNLTEGSDAIYQRIKGAMEKPQTGIPDTSNIPFLTGKQAETQTALAKIAKASETTAQNTKPDVREMLFGGGDRGRSGVSLLDISPRTGPGAAGPYNDRGPRKVEIKADQGATALEKGIVEVLRQNLPTVLRSLGFEAGFVR